MKKALIGINSILLVLILAACGDTSQEDKKDIKELVHEYSVGSHEDVSASINSQELIVTDHNQKKETYPLPEDEFFVSIAPFEESTHECAIHSLTSCQGELVEKEFNVYIEDEEGNVVVDDTFTSFANGFIDLWLPRDRTYQVKIEYDGKAAESTISTFDGDNTCITTMQLL
ncbi:CueP family metal-binding protein [Ornithinibacillus sp. BX22]|uniref:CueP family metal-binding protein n=1 Tax=Ornithinibacillus hominis TaxID=2763055 RepID=A0A923RJL0_9BACI|nr:CueP family metal-binding protein [Ornithinibacillus hominis]MBC5638089.1 CueP family metal-binding protein [Ornithinibacillus hominis]